MKADFRLMGYCIPICLSISYRSSLFSICNLALLRVKQTFGCLILSIIFSLIPGILFFSAKAQVNLNGISMGKMTDYLFVFTDGSVNANWQGSTKGYLGDIAIDGLSANERTSGGMAFAGTIYTNSNTIGEYQNILNNNPANSASSLNQLTRIANLKTELEYAFLQINALPVTPGYAGIDATYLDGLNTQNGVNQTFVFNITSGFDITTFINISGDAGDLFILRWDTDQNFSNGYNGQVKFASGGAIVPHGSLMATNFISVAGDIKSSGGGNTPASPFPQGPRQNNGLGNLINGGNDFSGGGFFTGYWLTTGSPMIFPPGEQPYGETSSQSNAIFVGGWYTKTNEFSLTSGSAGVYVLPNESLVYRPLPISLIAFSATLNYNTNKAVLKWTTISEENFSHIVVEKSLDGITFKEAATVFAVGSPTRKTDYNYADDVSTEKPAVIYYRLRFINPEGKNKISDTRIIRVNKQSEKNMMLLTFPNPVTSVLGITIPDNWQNKKVMYELINGNGNLIKRTEISNSSQTETLDVSNLQQGYYIVRVNCEGQSSHQKVIKK